MLDMRRREEADGESRMIGSGRREGFLGRETREEEDDEEIPAVAVDVGTAAVETGWFGRGRLRARNISADFRTLEKSCGERVQPFESSPCPCGSERIMEKREKWH